MHILLTHNVPYLGKPGDLVRVRPGYARNYLLPQGLATFATPHNLRIVERHRERLRQLEQAKRADLMNLGAQIAQRVLTIEANANEEGHLYGSVNADQIAATLQADNFPIERRSDVRTMRLIGISRLTVLRTVITEAVLIATVASVAGVVLGALISVGVNAYYGAFYDTTLRFAILTPQIVITAIILGIVLGVAAGTLAALRLLRLPPQKLGER